MYVVTPIPNFFSNSTAFPAIPKLVKLAVTSFTDTTTRVSKIESSHNFILILKERGYCGLPCTTLIYVFRLKLPNNRENGRHKKQGKLVFQNQYKWRDENEICCYGFC